MFGLSLVDTALQLGDSLIKRFWPDPEQQAAARLKLRELQQAGELQEIEIGLSAIIAEAKSADKWTSRARPSFLYVMYGVILLCVLGGIVGIWFPAEVTQAAANINALLGAIPESLWWLFGSGYLGYTGARSFDKTQLMKMRGKT